jgi:hypothetical protein
VRVNKEVKMEGSYRARMEDGMGEWIGRTFILLTF